MNTLKNMGTLKYNNPGGPACRQAGLRSKFIIFACTIILVTGLCPLAYAANHAPAILPIGSQEVIIGNTLTFTATASDPDGDNLTYSCPNLPAAATLDPLTGSFSWTPVINQVGTYALTITATDDGHPVLSTSETIPCNVIFRTVMHEKVFGFGVGSGAVVIEARSLVELFPKVSKLEIDGQTISPSQKSISTASNPRITVNLSSPYNITQRTVTLLLDGSEVRLPSFYNVQTFGDQKSTLNLSFDAALNNLSAGDHVLTIKAGNELGMASQSITLSVGGLRIIGLPLPFPSPYSAGRGNLTLQYNLSQDADIDILIFGSSFQVVKKITVTKGQEGGKTGINNVVWDGRTDFSTIASNGIYVAAIVDRATQTILAKVKITVF